MNEVTEYKKLDVQQVCYRILGVMGAITQS